MGAKGERVEEGGAGGEWACRGWGKVSRRR